MESNVCVCGWVGGSGGWGGGGVGGGGGGVGGGGGGGVNLLIWDHTNSCMWIIG